MRGNHRSPVDSPHKRPVTRSIDVFLLSVPEQLRRQSLHWCHNELDSVSNHQPRDCLLNRLFRRRWKKISKLRVTDLCAENSPETGEFPAQMANNAENVSIWWRHHGFERPSCSWRYLMLYRGIITTPRLFWKTHISGLGIPSASYQIRKIAGCPCTGNAGNVFPRRRL